VKETLADLRRTAQGTANLVPPILEAVRVYATLGEISDILREVFGNTEKDDFKLQIADRKLKCLERTFNLKFEICNLKWGKEMTRKIRVLIAKPGWTATTGGRR